jgi:hypothetical protein
MNNLIVKEIEEFKLRQTIADELILIDKEEKELKQRKEKIREILLKEMEDKGIIKISDENISITYKAPAEKETFRTKDFKKDLPDLYDTYVEFTPVKSSLLIKIK